MAMTDSLTVHSPERRQRADRRQQQVRVATERRRGDRRLQSLDETGRKSAEEQEFQRAMQHLCRLVRYPTCQQVLQVVHGLGYRLAPDKTTSGA